MLLFWYTNKIKDNSFEKKTKLSSFIVLWTFDNSYMKNHIGMWLLTTILNQKSTKILNLFMKLLSHLLSSCNFKIIINKNCNIQILQYIN